MLWLRESQQGWAACAMGWRAVVMLGAIATLKTEAQ